MRINTNISALKTNTTLNRSNDLLTQSLERLSSGYRINSAADDAAGMAISQKMRTQIAGLEQANRNSSDGTSLIQTAEGALSEVTNILQRMRELAVQSANGTNTDTDRDAIQAEIDTLNEEIDRISTTTEFNTINLLDGSADRKSFSNVTSVELVSASDAVSAGSYELEITQDARQAVLTGLDITSLEYPITSEYVGTININGVDATIEEGDTLDEVYTKIREAAEKSNVNVFAAEADATPGTPTTDNEETAQYEAVSIEDAGQLIFVTQEYGANQSITLNCSNSALAEAMGMSTSEVTTTGRDVEATLIYSTTKVAQTDNDGNVVTDGEGNTVYDEVETDSKFSTTATISTSGNTIKITDKNGFEMKFETSCLGLGSTVDATVSGDATDYTESTTSTSVTVSVLNAGSLKLQVGASEGQTVEITIPKVNCKTLGIENCNLSTSDGAESAITLYDDAITTVSTIRAKLGAYENRLEYTSSNLTTAQENMTEALSRIQDTDMATEMANYTQYNVLVQAGTAMLAQANQRPQTILSLLNA